MYTAQSEIHFVVVCIKLASSIGKTRVLSSTLHLFCASVLVCGYCENSKEIDHARVIDFSQYGFCWVRCPRRILLQQCKADTLYPSVRALNFCIEILS